MSYKIVITEIKSVPKTETESFLLEERHYTDAEINDNHRYMQEADKVKYTKKLYGHKDVPASQEKELKVFEQVVEQLDMKVVIGAINK